MREELKQDEKYFWSLTKGDLEATSLLVKSYMKAFWKDSIIPKDSKLITPEMDLYLEVHYREMQFLIQFGIWRLQSIFESLLKIHFEIESKVGLNDILNKLTKKGYKLIKRPELQEWVNLRNKFSHAAPEVYHPSPINLIEQDLDDFSDLLFEIYSDLEVQKTKICSV